MNKLALAMIVAATDEEAPYLAKCFENINRHVDAIYINLNHKPGQKPSERVKKLCEQYKATVYETEWDDNFANARNFIFSKVPEDYNWILWLDADDTVKNPRKLKDIINVVSQNVGGIFAKYDYTHDDLGNVTYEHWVIRLCRNNGAYKWRSSFDDESVSVHETLQDIRTTTNVRTEEFTVVHGTTKARGKDSLQRNIKLLEGMYKRQQDNGNLDPRTVFYLATHYFDASNGIDIDLIERTEKLLVQYLEMSGWAEERSEAWVYLGLVFSLQQRNDAARQAFGKAIMENPVNPKPYVELGELEFKEKRYPMSEEWLLMAIGKKLPTTSTVIMPMENSFRAYLLLAQTYVNMGFAYMKKALKYVNMALELRPTDIDAKAAQELIEKLIAERENTKAIVRVANLMRKDKRALFTDLLPDDMQDNPAVINVRQASSIPRKWKKKDIAIFCGNSAQGIWGPKDLDGTGMGGSEEAVIKMSKELTALGYAVTIYATPGEQRGVVDGVTWLNYWEFNAKDTFNIVIAWRMPWFFDANIKARKSFLWLHDVMAKEEFTDERLKNITACIFVSQYHADLYTGVIPDEKRFVSGNGITPNDFALLDATTPRDLYRCIYTSSQLRGLELLLDIWGDVKEAVPLATLDCYYGWETFDEGNRNNPERMAWKAALLRKIDSLDGVTDHGRVGQADLNKELFNAGVFAYPCWFPEVYCISLIKAQAAGCFPVTSDFAVLKDFNKLGEQVPYDPKDIPDFKQRYTETLIAVLNDKARAIPQEAVEQLREDFSWAKTAQGWDTLFS